MQSSCIQCAVHHHLRRASLYVFLGRVWPPVQVQCRDQTVSPEKRSVSSNSYYLVSDRVLTLTMPGATLVYVQVGMDDSGHCPSLSSLSFPLFLSCFFPLPGETAVGKSSLVLRFVKGQFNPNQEVTIGGKYTSHKKVFQMKTSACRDGTLKNHPNKMGTTPQHI